MCLNRTGLDREGRTRALVSTSQRTSTGHPNDSSQSSPLVLSPGRGRGLTYTPSTHSGLSDYWLRPCWAYMYADSLRFLFGQWGSDDYSHGFFVPIISLFLIWQSRHRVVRAGIRPSWWGPGIVLVGLLLYVIGDYATLYIVLHLSLWIVIVGLVLSFIGPVAATGDRLPVNISSHEYSVAGLPV